MIDFLCLVIPFFRAKIAQKMPQIPCMKKAEVHVSVFVDVFDFEMIPIHTFILKNVNPPQKQKLQSLLPFELFRMIFCIKCL